MSSLVENLNNFLNPPNLSSPVLYTELFIENSIIDKDFDLEELKNVITKCRITRHQVPYEFFKNAFLLIYTQLLIS